MSRTSGLVLTFLLLLTCSPALARTLDSFEDISRWEALASEGAEISIDTDAGYSGKSLRLDFDFRATGGYVNVKKKIQLQLPENYAFGFYIRGNGPPNNLEFKLLDPTGRNVWWHNDRSFEFSTDWQHHDVWQSEIQFAWGPNPGPASRVGYIEFTVKASKGGKGTVWIDQLTFERRIPDHMLPWPPPISASFPSVSTTLATMFDGQLDTGWHSDTKSSERQSLTFDFTQKRLYGGLIIDWDPEDYASAFAILIGDDSHTWRTVYSTGNHNGERSYVYLPSCASRFLRLDFQASHEGRGYGIREIALQPYGFSQTTNSFFTAIAHDSPLGAYPKYLIEKQTYWSEVGVDGDAKEGLINEEGMIEVDAQSFSIEPMMLADGQVLTWHDVETSQQLRDGYLPVPTVTWRAQSLRLEITAAAAGPRDHSTLYARYLLHNEGQQEKRIKFYLALRPFQVNPPWQTLEVAGGTSQIWGIERKDDNVFVRSRPDAVAQRVQLLSPPGRFGAAQFEQGTLLDFVGRGEVPAQSKAEGGMGYASGILQYEINLSPGEHQEVQIAVPWYADSQVEGDANTAIDAAAAEWRERLKRIHLSISRHPQYEDLVRSTVAYILINRDGPAIQPGSRTYARSWIRDGALTSAALLELGFKEEVRDYLSWYATKQFASGRIPCCVDARGPDPTPEHDSDGEFIYALAEYFRHSGDAELVRSLWPVVVAAVDHLTQLRQQRMKERYERPEKRAYYGLLPESISHEGYAAQPVHSYWDDFFALRGFGDAAMLAVVVGDGKRAEQYSQLREAFEQNLIDSITWTVADNAISYIPGSVELGDFDPTATSILFALGLRLPTLDRRLLPATFERYYNFFHQRATNEVPWTNYAPYEFRNVHAFVHLGQRERAAEVLQFMTLNRQPHGWNLWPEIIWRDVQEPHFIGDMPHTWVGSGFISAVRSMLVYEEPEEKQLVLAAGVPADWLDDDGKVQVMDLPTEFGPISYELHRSDGRVHMEVTGELSTRPTRVILRPPLPATAMVAIVNGAPGASFDGQSLMIEQLPASVVFEAANTPTP